jgi:branched-chain amino acid transport system substrate-binding protein
LEWGKGPNGNVVVTPILGGQWISAASGSQYPLDFVLCENSSDPNVPVAAKLKAYTT